MSSRFLRTTWLRKGRRSAMNVEPSPSPSPSPSPPSSPLHRSSNLDSCNQMEQPEATATSSLSSPKSPLSFRSFSDVLKPKMKNIEIDKGKDSETTTSSLLSPKPPLSFHLSDVLKSKKLEIDKGKASMALSVPPPPPTTTTLNPPSFVFPGDGNLVQKNPQRSKFSTAGSGSSNTMLLESVEKGQETQSISKAGRGSNNSNIVRFDKLPDHLLGEIFVRLPVQDLLRVSFLSMQTITIPYLQFNNGSSPVFNREEFKRFKERIEVDNKDPSGRSVIFVSRVGDIEEEVHRMLQYSLFFRYMNFTIKVPWLTGQTPLPFGHFPLALTFDGTVLRNEMSFDNLNTLKLEKCSCIFPFLRTGDFVLSAPKLETLVITNSFDHLCWNFCSFRLSSERLQTLDITGFLFSSYYFEKPLDIINEATLKLWSLPRDNSLWPYVKPDIPLALSQLLGGVSRVKCLSLSLAGLTMCHNLSEYTNRIVFVNLESFKIEAGDGESVSLALLIENIVRSASQLKVIHIEVQVENISLELTSFGQRVLSLAPTGAEVWISRVDYDGKLIMST